MTTDLTRLAPHVDPAWADELVLELRLRDVPGDRIGDALATVDAHVVDSGETAEEAFGPARDYARETAEAQTGAIRPVSGRWWCAVLLGMLGAYIAATGAAPLLLGRDHVELTVSDLVLLGVQGLVVLALWRWFAPAARAAVRTPWRVALVVGGLTAAVVALLVTLGGGRGLIELPPGLVALAGVVLLAISSGLALGEARGGRVDDPVVSPGSRPGPDVTGRWFAVAFFPALAVLLTLLDVVPLALA